MASDHVGGLLAIGSQVVVLIGGGYDIELASNFQTAISEHRQQGRVLESWQMKFERYSDNTPDYLIFAIFKQEWTP